MKKEIGIDIVKISRFRVRKYSSNEKFYEKIFSKIEITYCLKYKDPYPHFAGKFAAKEAIIKATGMKTEFNNIIINTKSNGLEVKINDKVKSNILVSIAHEKDYAIAMSMIF